MKNGVGFPRRWFNNRKQVGLFINQSKFRVRLQSRKIVEEFQGSYSVANRIGVGSVPGNPGIGG